MLFTAERPDLRSAAAGILLGIPNYGSIYFLIAALQQSGLPPQLLQLELTEGILMQDVDLALQRILALKALGVSVAVDDFGTGYSSLAHLKRFPIDVLKIDRYFVSDIQDAAVNEALVSSILGLCQRLELDAVVEGVENRQQLESLRRLGSQIVATVLSTPELRALIEAARQKTELEDLYLPYRPKRRTRATIARERGLEPLADLIARQHLSAYQEQDKDDR